MQVGAAVSVVLVGGIALLVGALLRMFARPTQVVFPVALLLGGVATGALSQTFELGPLGAAISKSEEIAAEWVSFILLPAVVFAAAYAIDLRELRRNLGAIATLAGPVALAGAVATAAWLLGTSTLLGQTWSWPGALGFGVLVSATDPTGAVATLRRQGMKKRLGTLLEAEGLLSAGTAAAAFALVLPLLSFTAELDAATLAVDFLGSAGGGAALGLAVAYLVGKWLTRLVDDPAAEAALTLVVAAACMFVAERVLGVSGIVAVIVAGLGMNGSTKAQSGGETNHLVTQRFWHLFGYLGTTLISFVTGLAVSASVAEASGAEALLVVTTYVGIVLIRFALTFASRPLMNRMSDGISWADTTVVAWSGVRWTLPLALALLVFHEPGIDAGLRGQVLLLAVGVALCSALVNGSSVGPVAKTRGDDHASLSKQLADLVTRSLALEEVRERLEDVTRARDLQTVSWSEVVSKLDERRAELRGRIKAKREELSVAPPLERAIGAWTRVLDLERQTYFAAFKEGTLSQTATTLLTREVDHQLDRLTHGDVTPPATRAPVDDTKTLVARLFDRSGRSFDELAGVYDLSRGECRAAARVLGALEQLGGMDEDVVETIRATYSGYLRTGKERVEDLRTNLPEMATTAERRLASRISLNLEREAYEHLVERGIVEAGDAERYLEPVERAVRELVRSVENVPIPETAKLVASTPLFKNLSEQDLAQLSAITEDMVLGKGELLFQEGQRGDALYVIARGAAHVLIGDQIVDVLGGGELIGEMALLSGSPRVATVRAGTALTLGKISRQDFLVLMQDHPTLAEQVVEEFVRRSFENHLRQHPEFSRLDAKEQMAWLGRGRLIALEPGTAPAPTDDHAFLFVATGTLRSGAGVHVSPALVTLAGAGSFVAELEAKIVLLPKP